MILNTDEEIIETIMDDTPLSIGLLKKLGWVHETGHARYIGWTTFSRPDITGYPFIERFNNGNYYLYLNKNRECDVRIHTVGDLRKHKLLW